MVYPILKWIHILMAIVAIGSNATYGIWIARASGKPEALPFTMRGIKLIDDRFANPAYGMLLITGLLMVYQARPLLTAPWLQTALVLYGSLVLLGVLGYSPTLKKQIQLLESQGFASPEYQATSKRGMVIGILTAVLAIAIVFLMVVKPSLWG